MSDPVRVLLAVAALAALSLLSVAVSSSAWLWVLLAGALGLYFHARTRLYGLLVVGALLVGAAVGILLEVALEWSGAFLVSVGSAATTPRRSPPHTRSEYCSAESADRSSTRLPSRLA